MRDKNLQGLAALQDTFPKTCQCCGRVYEAAEDFLFQTQGLAAGKSSLKEIIDDDDRVVVAVFRNCICGSTLMDEFQSRRDESPDGQRRREDYAKNRPCEGDRCID